MTALPKGEPRVCAPLYRRIPRRREAVRPYNRLPYLRLILALSFRASDRRHWRGNPFPAPAGAESLRLPLRGGPVLAAKQVPLGCTLGCAAKRSGGGAKRRRERRCTTAPSLLVRRGRCPHRPAAFALCFGRTEPSAPTPGFPAANALSKPNQRPKAATYLCRFAAKARFDNRPNPRVRFPKGRVAALPFGRFKERGFLRGEGNRKPSPLKWRFWLLLSLLTKVTRRRQKRAKSHRADDSALPYPRLPNTQTQKRDRLPAVSSACR